MHKWITLLYSTNLHNIVNQLYVNKLNLTKQESVNLLNRKTCLEEYTIDLKRHKNASEW